MNVPALAIARFEVRQRMRRLSTWIYFALFFGIAMLCVAAAGGALKGARVEFGGGGKVFVNSPYSIQLLETLIGLFGTVTVASIAGQATFQDVDHRATALFFTTPIRERDYIAGRFLGAFVVCVFVYAGIGLGTACAMHLPLDVSRLGPPPGALAYLQPYLVALLPNLFVTVAIFFAVATLSRRMLPVYAGSVVLMLGYLVALNLSDDVENKTLLSLLDPFGFIATARFTEYWTVVERNTRRVPLAGIVAASRAVWLAAGAALVALTYARFSFVSSARARGAASTEPEKTPAAPRPRVVPLDFSRRASAALLLRLAALQWRETVKSVIFVVLVLAGLLLMASTAQSLGRLFGTPTWPVTYQVLETVGGNFQLVILAVITFYSGELVWRERDAKLAQIYDALPTPRWVVFASKWLALVGAQILLLAIVLVAGVVLQTATGYHRHELGLYARWLFVLRLTDLAFLCTIALFVHVVVNQKYFGHAVMVGYYVVLILLPQLGLEHRLYRVGSQPEWIYSDMNGFGHFTRQLFWFRVYWGSLALVLAVASNLLWVRGVEGGLRRRLALARARLGGVSLAAIAAGLVTFAGTGAFLYREMNVVRPYRTAFDQDELVARWEKRFKTEWDGAAQPRVVGAKVDADIFPAARRIALRGELAIENRTAGPIARLFVNVPEQSRVDELVLDRGERLVTDEKDLGVRIYELGRPLQPNERATLRFAVTHEERGIPNGRGDLHVVENGTFFNNRMYVPSLAYDAGEELHDDDTRRKHGLAPKARMRDLDDPVGLANNYLSKDADWIRFEGTLSTSPDQIAIAPGYLVREWNEDGRRHFRYVMDAPILDFYSFISARYAVRRDAWNDVAIEVYHHPTHTFDVDRMIRSIKASLDYFTREFGPYQHRQVRIIEFPRFETFAQSFPNTIPYSEAVGFIARVDDRDPESIDYPFYVTSHEVAHQWWAHQVIGGDVQGATMLSESFAQYSALMVMKHTYGERAMKKFLRYELDRYLRGRGNERKKELPLARVENQPYIHYSKGSLVLYGLQDAIGEATVNRALRTFLERTKYTGPPYPSTRAFLAALRAEAPASAEPLIQDLFEAITLYELRATSATATKRADGRWDVHVKATAKKLHASELGAETEAPIDEEIGFGALDEHGEAIHLEKVRVDRPEIEVSFTTDRKPAKAGIDPLNIRVDRNPDDNVVRVEESR